MPGLDFKKRFAEPVKAGEKTQSIRKRRKTPIKKGDHLYLVDGSGYVFRAYHALPPLSRKSDGLPTGAVSHTRGTSSVRLRKSATAARVGVVRCDLRPAAVAATVTTLPRVTWARTKLAATATEGLARTGWSAAPSLPAERPLRLARPNPSPQSVDPRAA